MIPAGTIVDNVLTAMRRSESKQARADVWKWLNQEYFDLCRIHSWHALRQKLTLDTTEDTEEVGMWLPANLFGIDRVRDNDRGFEFYPRDRAEIEPDEHGYRYYTYCPSQTPVFFDEECSVDHGDTTFVCDNLTDDYTDDYVQFGECLGYYLLTAIKTFEPAYYGNDLTEAEVRIRPATTQRLVIIDKAENMLTDREIDVYYWQAPQPLFFDSDPCILPTGRSLELKVLIRAMGIVGKRQIATDRYRGEVADALAEEIKLNPAYPRASRPRDVHNRVFNFDNRLFAHRDTTSSNTSGFTLRKLVDVTDD